MIDFSNYKFRCSGLKYLMTDVRGSITPKQLELIGILQEKESLTEKQQATLSELIAKRDAKPELSDSTKTYLRDIFIKEVYGRVKPDIDTKYTRKGIAVEPDSMELVRQVTGKIYFKNLNPYENEFIKGTPDIKKTRDRFIRDTKSSWSIWTFAAVDEKKARSDYFYQMLGYMWLTGRKWAQLMYCLVNTPEEIIEREMYKASFSNEDLLNHDEVAVAEFRKNYVFDDIPAKQRLKRFTFEYDEQLVEQLKQKVILSREYLNGLSL